MLKLNLTLISLVPLTPAPSSPSNPTPSIAAASRDSTPPAVATTTRETIFFDGETTTMTL
ncbi:hypothetical protein HKD37_19G054644 [Glycine soja]